MADEKKIVDGEIVDSPTGRLVRRDPEPQLFPAVRKSPPTEALEAQQRLLERVDTRGVEEAIFNAYIGNLIGLCYDPEAEAEDEAEREELLKPENRRIILTDENWSKE